MSSSDKLTLFELNQLIRKAISDSFSKSYWVVAEISELKEATNGHCYLELIQKDENQDIAKARARATIWAYTYRMLKPYFETSTSRPLSPGLKILVQAEVVFHEVFGLSLNIVDIEPTFTLGDIEQKRRETIEKLVSEGIFNMNKELKIPVLPKKVAVISSPIAAGYQDFVNQITSNSYGYVVEYKLFEATMQGNDAVGSIINALERVFEVHDKFDIVIIIRGGGSQADLSCFDSYLLSSHVAQFPVPIVTGIGHQKDTTVVDLVANTKLKTPTAVAEFIIEKYIAAESFTGSLVGQFVNLVENQVSEKKMNLNRIYSILPSVVLSRTSGERLVIEKKGIIYKSQIMRIIDSRMVKLRDYRQNLKIGLLKKTERLNYNNNQLFNRFNNTLKSIFVKEFSKLQLNDNKLTNLDPINILGRGYSITLHNGKMLTNPERVNAGDLIQTILKEGEIKSVVK